jgi:phosphatidylglycerophosphate synthase
MWLLIAGEIIIALPALYYKQHGMSATTTWAGKWAMVYKMLAIGFILTAFSFDPTTLDVERYEVIGHYMIFASLLIVPIVLTEHFKEYRALTR